MLKYWLITIPTFVAIAACSSDNITSRAPVPQATVVSASGDIIMQVNNFRGDLGPPNGTTAGQQADGRREINWDGAGANAFDNKNDFPANFFNTNVKSGAVFTTDGTGFRNDSTAFSDINPGYATQFGSFSPTKIFAPVGSNQLDQLFEVAGQPTPAVSRGIGVVFSDVDLADKTTIALFAQDGTNLGTFPAPVRSDAAGLSFLGVSFTDAIIARVRITLGTGALATGVNDISAGGTADLVVLDNLIYGEPKKAF